MPPVPAILERQFSRAELCWLVGAIVTGSILRLSFSGRMAIEHFDEGVYSSNFWFGVEQGYRYPAQHLYAPPLLPLAIEWTMITASLCGIKPIGFIPMIPSLIAGIATIPSMWWVGRRWFGPTSGIVAAWFVAASDFHASYSRAALTDVPVCLFILWGVHFSWLALQSGARRDILLAGLFTGLAWWTKYNGWLPLAIGLTGGAAWQLTFLRSERDLQQFATRWLLIALTAFIIWSPVLIGLQKYGGYAAVAANHQQYIEGPSHWGDNAVNQLMIAGVYDNWLGYFGEVTEALRQASQRKSAPAFGPVGLTEQTTLGREAANFTSPTIVIAAPILLALATLQGGIWRLALASRSCHALATWLLGSWFLGLTVTIPFYHHYPRLALPWLMTVWLGSGLAVQLWLESRLGKRETTFQPHWHASRFVMVIVAWLVSCDSVRGLARTIHCWEDRRGMQQNTLALSKVVRDEMTKQEYPPNEAIVYVEGLPAMVWGFHSLEMPLVAPVQDLGFVNKLHPRPVYFVSVRRLGSMSDAPDSTSVRFQPVAVSRHQKSTLDIYDGGSGEAPILYRVSF